MHVKSMNKRYWYLVVLSFLVNVGLGAGCIPDLGSALEDIGVTDGGNRGDGTTPGRPDSSVQVPDSGPVDLVALGKEVFFRQGDTVHGGCYRCHGEDANGKNGAPRIRGKSRETIANALETVPEMDFLDLTEQEIDAVAAYLGWLATQP
ncbi:MAG: cytochrome c [Deltaproteobacteria bacterium]|nr:cytochrome c [Deltaproteobacteria bacterium]